MPDLFDPVWAVDGEVLVPSEAQIRNGFSCGPVSPALFNYLFQSIEQTINSLEVGGTGVSEAREIATTEGVQGGGDLSADRIIRLHINGLDTTTSIANDDLVVIYDQSEGEHRAISRENFVSGLGGGGGGGGGGVDAGENVGTGAGSIFSGLSSTTMQFRKIKAGGGMDVSTISDDVVVALADMGTELTV